MPSGPETPKNRVIQKLFVLNAILLVYLFSPIQASGSVDGGTVQTVNFLSYAQQTADIARRDAWDTSFGGFYISLDRTWSTYEGECDPNDPYYKSSFGNVKYAESFLFLYDKTGITTYLSWARETIDVILNNAWDTASGGVYDAYDRSWTPVLSHGHPSSTGSTCKTIYFQAWLLHVLVDLYQRTNDSRYADYANKLANFIISKYYDNVYGGVYRTYDEAIDEPVSTNKYVKAQGLFGWGMVSWYRLSGNSTALTLTRETNEFIWNYMYDQTYGGLFTEVDRQGTGTVIHGSYDGSIKYPNEAVQGIAGMLAYYEQTGRSDAELLRRIRLVLNHANTYLWDSEHGGWFRSLYRDNTVRKSTKEGWSQGDQPLFWLYAYQVTGDTVYRDITEQSAKWTVDHNYDSQYGGFYLELSEDGQTVVFHDKDDYVQGGSIASMVAVSTESATGNPVAIAGPDLILTDSDGTGTEVVTLDGSASYDPDGTITSYEWVDGSNVLGATAILTKSLAEGSHTITLTVTDNEQRTAKDAIVITINPNQIPRANAGADQTVVDEDDDGFETIRLNGAASSDLDGTILSYEWVERSTVLGSLAIVEVNFPIGTYHVELYVTDDGGATDTDYLIIIVNPYAEQHPAVFAYPEDESWTESASGWTFSGGSFSTSSDAWVGLRSLNFVFVGTSGGHRYFERSFDVSPIDNTYKLQFWHKGDNIRWTLSDQYSNWQFYYHNGDLKSGWTGQHDDWTLIEIDLSDIPMRDPDGEDESIYPGDCDNFSDIEGVIFGDWMGAEIRKVNVFIDGLQFVKQS